VDMVGDKQWGEEKAGSDRAIGTIHEVANHSAPAPASASALMTLRNEVSTPSLSPSVRMRSGGQTGRQSAPQAPALSDARGVGVVVDGVSAGSAGAPAP
jgi:hypothetical protein